MKDQALFHSFKSLSKTALLPLTPFLFAPSAMATISVTIDGVADSNVINYTVSGSVTASESILARSSGVALLPTSEYSFSFDDGFGDVLLPFGFFENRDLALSAPIPISVLPLGSSVPLPSFGVWDTIDFRSTSNDAIQFDPTGNIAYPALAAGDALFIPLTSGTFTLDSGTFSTVFTEGSFESDETDEDGNSIFVVNVESVPEPSVGALGGIALLGLLRRRR